MHTWRLALSSALIAFSAACTEGPNLFTIEDDVELGQQLRDEINSDPDTYPVVAREDAPGAYDELERMMNAVLDSGEVELADEFEWEIALIDDDKTLNAFAAPGGYIWVYSGLMRFLEVEDDFVGVLGHEIAHADQRHGTDTLTRRYGEAVLLELLFGEDPGLIAELAAGLTELNFSRNQEAEADEYSVIYLCATNYAANGAAGFFEQLLEEGTAGVPEFLSTHPASDSRVEDINLLATERGCSTELNPTVPSWASVLATLP